MAATRLKVSFEVVDNADGTHHVNASCNGVDVVCLTLPRDAGEAVGTLLEHALDILARASDMHECPHLNTTAVRETRGNVITFSPHTHTCLACGHEVPARGGR